MSNNKMKIINFISITELALNRTLFCLEDISSSPCFSQHPHEDHNNIMSSIRISNLLVPEQDFPGPPSGMWPGRK